jgi:hypothetical protein
MWLKPEYKVQSAGVYMRLLWVNMGGLWPANTNERARSLQIVSELSRRHRVTLITTHGPGDDPAGLARFLPEVRQVVSIPYATPTRGSSSFLKALVRSWLSSYPLDLHYWRLPECQNRVRQLMDRELIDICISDSLLASVNMPTNTSVPVVLFAHKVEYLMRKRVSDGERNLLKRALLEVEWRKLRRKERDLCGRADLTITVSEEDEQCLCALAPDTVVSCEPAVSALEALCERVARTHDDGGDMDEAVDLSRRRLPRSRGRRILGHLHDAPVRAHRHF